MSLERWLRNTALVLVVAGMLVSAAQAEESNTQSYELDIDALPLMAAVKTLADETGIEVLFFSEIAEGITSSPVQGRFTANEALGAMLEETNLEVVALDGEGVVAIRFSEEVSAPGKHRPAPRQVSMARSQASGQQTMPPAATSPDTGDERHELRNLEEIVVTGSQIRGSGAVGANVVTLDREYIELSGQATPMDILRDLPQNVGLGANETTGTVGVAPGSFNYGSASSVNLRGLGTASTLLLVNGRRSASGGGHGDFVDLNSIPASAIQRIEVLPDGASAVYGSDAVGGVVNVILRDDYDGAESSFQYAPAINDIAEARFSQVFGRSWDGGNALLNYEFYDRSHLLAEDRVYTKDSDLTRLGGTNHSRTASNPGNINRYTLAGGTLQTVDLAIPVGQDGTSLTPDALIADEPNLQNIRAGSTVLPSQRRHSVFARASQQLSKGIELFAEARYSTRDFESRPQLPVTSNLTVPSSNPFFVDPIGGATALRIDYSFVDDYGTERSYGSVDTLSATLGAVFRLGRDWELEAYASQSIEDTYSRSDNFPNTALLNAALADSNPDTAFNPFGDGSHTNAATLAAIEGFREFDLGSELSVVNLRADGGLFELPGGPAKLAVGAQYRDESLSSAQLNFSTTLEPTPSTAAFDLHRGISAAFAEVFLPVVTERNSRPAIRRLALSVAARYERYSDFGSTLNPKVGVSWAPVEGLAFRSTLGTSFRAPLLVELDDTQQAYQVVNVADPASITGSTSTLFLFGNNPTLDAQEGTTWTAGFDVMPAALRGFRGGVTWFTTEVDDMIALPGNLITLPFQRPDVYAEIIDREPDAETLAALLSNPRCFCGSATPEDVEAIIDFRRQNLAKAQLSGIDVNMSYSVGTDAGTFDLSLYGSHLFEFKEQLVNGPLEDNVDTIAKPNSLRLRGSLSWSSGGVNAALIGSHVGSYTDDRSDPERRVSSWTTWNLRLGYDFPEQTSGLLAGTAVSLSIRNVLDRDPPFVDLSNGVGFDAINANALQRAAVVQFTKEWQ